MGWVFYLLLLTNVALLLWRFGVGLSPSYLPREAPSAWQRPPQVRPLWLLGEEQKDQQNADLAAPEPLCRWLGPFADAAAAQVFIARIAALDVMSALQADSTSTGETFWVYLASFGNRNAAKQTLAELQARGVDSYIVSKGDMENAISLGVFSDLTLAQARLQDMVELGLEPLLQSVNRPVAQYWVSVEEQELKKVGDSAWQRIVNDQFKLTERQKFCLDVASQ